MLCDLDCDLAQGYWIARPMPANDFANWLADNSWGLRLGMRE
jgi:EAL domain-containing protein (putative c-di-GMP-specific phosphodiesterase class I)